MAHEVSISPTGSGQVVETMGELGKQTSRTHSFASFGSMMDKTDAFRGFLGLFKGTLLEVLRWRSTNGDIFYWRFLVGSVGVTLALTFAQIDIWGGGEQPWSLLAPLLAPFASYFFVRGWAYAKPLPYLCGFILLMVGGVLPFALIQPV